MRMVESGGLAAPTAVVSNSQGVQIDIKVTDIDIKMEAFIMVLMVGVVEEIVTTKEGLEWRETCWGIPKVWVEQPFGLGALEPMMLDAPVSLLYHCCSNANGAEPLHITWVSMEILGVFFIYLAKGLEVFNAFEFNCSSLGLVQLKLQFIL